MSISPFLTHKHLFQDILWCVIINANQLYNLTPETNSSVKLSVNSAENEKCFSNTVFRSPRNIWLVLVVGWEPAQTHEIQCKDEQAFYTNSFNLLKLHREGDQSASLNTGKFTRPQRTRLADPVSACHRIRKQTIYSHEKMLYLNWSTINEF